MNYQASEAWRTERLQKAVRIASTILGMNAPQLESLLDSVEDSRGMLITRWRHPMTQQQITAFETAWSMCGEKASVRAVVAG